MRAAEDAFAARRSAEAERDRIAEGATELSRSLEASRGEIATLRAKIADLEMLTQNLQHTAATAGQEIDDARRRTQESEAERQRLQQAVSQSDGAREAAERARQHAEAEAAKAARERDSAVAAMRRLTEERDALAAKLNEREQWVDQLAEAVTQQRDQLGMLSKERDQARAASDQARSLIDELTQQLRVIMPSAGINGNKHIPMMRDSREWS
jgi:chromosome segregation ATPase